MMKQEIEYYQRDTTKSSHKAEHTATKKFSGSYGQSLKD